MGSFRLPIKVWKPVMLPYARSNSLLPEKLPTTEEIRASNALISQRTGQTILAVTPYVLVKFGQSTTQNEGQTLLYLERHVPHVPAPRLYAMYYDSGDLFIVMQRISGIRLDTLWGGMSEQEKVSLAAKLSTIFGEMSRAVCPWTSYFGAINGGPVPHHLFYSADGNEKLSGPFKDEAQFNLGLVGQYKMLKEMNGKRDFKGVFYAKHLDAALSGHKPTFTHSDVQKKNIVVTDIDRKGIQQHRDFEVALVDWETAGWYPDYWEYFAAFTGFRWDDDWCRRVEDFIAAWPVETAAMKMIYTDIFF